MSEYEEVAQRHESSLQQLHTFVSALDSKENADALSDRIRRDCEQMTLRVQFNRFEKERSSSS